MRTGRRPSTHPLRLARHRLGLPRSPFSWLRTLISRDPLALQSLLRPLWAEAARLSSTSCRTTFAGVVHGAFTELVSRLGPGSLGSDLPACAIVCTRPRWLVPLCPSLLHYYLLPSAASSLCEVAAHSSTYLRPKPLLRLALSASCPPDPVASSPSDCKKRPSERARASTSPYMRWPFFSRRFRYLYVHLANFSKVFRRSRDRAMAPRTRSPRGPHRDRHAGRAACVLCRALSG